MEERTAGALDDRDLMPGQEPVHGGSVDRLAPSEPVDREAAGGRGSVGSARVSHAAPASTTRPSSLTTRASEGGYSPAASGTRTPSSRTTHRAGANRRA